MTSLFVTMLSCVALVDGAAPTTTPTTPRPSSAPATSQPAAGNEQSPSESDPAYWFERAQDFVEKGKLDDALVAMKKMVELDPESAHSYSARGQILMQIGKASDAVPALKRAVELDPNNQNALHNLGQAYQLLEQWDDSNRAYQSLVAIDGDDWRSRSKIVQNYQALGKIEERDKARDEVLSLFRDGKIKQKSFCREQFRVDKQRVMAMEYFELKGERALRYTFFVLSDKGDEVEYRICLESDEADNALGKELGELKPGDRAFSLDAYYPREHRTYGLFNNEPSYESTRKLVVNILAGKAPVISSSSTENAASKPAK